MYNCLMRNILFSLGYVSFLIAVYTQFFLSVDWILPGPFCRLNMKPKYWIQDVTQPLERLTLNNCIIQNVLISLGYISLFMAV